jgi:hypothetical protein
MALPSPLTRPSTTGTSGAQALAYRAFLIRWKTHGGDGHQREEDDKRERAEHDVAHADPRNPDSSRT